MINLKSIIQSWSNLMVVVVSIVCSAWSLVYGTADTHLCVGLLIVGVIFVIYNWVAEVKKESRIITLEGKTFVCDMKVIEKHEFIYVILDSNEKFLFGIRQNGTVEWSGVIPLPINKIIRL